MLPKRAAIYTRISKDSEGQGLGVTRQREDCQRLAAARGWTVLREYCDNDVSAYRSRRRPQYEAMLADLEAGRVDGILCWDVDRLTRTPRELEQIIDLADRHVIALASVGGEIDLATPQGRLTARIKGSVARHESEQMSQRLKRKAAERAERRLPPTRRSYGWQRINGQNIIDLEQTKIVREIVDRILAGESMGRIASDLQERGVPPVHKDTWTQAMVRHLAMRPINVGDLVYRGEVIGKGDWEPIIPRNKHTRVVAYLSNPQRRVTSTNNYRRLLSGIARCGKCGGTMRIMSWKRQPTYVCSQCFGVRRGMEKVDEVVEKITIGRLQMPDARRAFAPPDDRGLVEQADHLRSRLDVAAAWHGEGKLDDREYFIIRNRLHARLDKVDAQIRQLEPYLGDIIQSGAVWDELPIERKRAIIALLFDVTILPARRRGARFDPRTVVVTAKGSPLGSAGLPAPPSLEP